MKAILKKNRSSEGFSLAETLVALIIILLVSSVVAAGMPAATQSYLKVRESANAQVYLSTVLTELRNEFTTAREIKPVEGGLQYINPITGESTIIFNSETGNFDLTTYKDLDGIGKKRQIVSTALSDRFSMVFEGEAVPLSYSDGVVKVSGFEVKSARTDSSPAKTAGYTIRVLTP